MPLLTPRPTLTKPRLVILTQPNPRRLLHMQIQTLVPVLAEPIRVVELALAHLAHVVLVQEVAVGPFLAEGFQPVLADVGFRSGVVGPVGVGGGSGGRGRVAVGAASPEWAVAGGVGGADWGRGD